MIEDGPQVFVNFDRYLHSANIHICQPDGKDFLDKRLMYIVERELWSRFSGMLMSQETADALSSCAQSFMRELIMQGFLRNYGSYWKFDTMRYVRNKILHPNFLNMRFHPNSLDLRDCGVLLLSEDGKELDRNIDLFFDTDEIDWLGKNIDVDVFVSAFEKYKNKKILDLAGVKDEG